MEALNGTNAKVNINSLNNFALNPSAIKTYPKPEIEETRTDTFNKRPIILPYKTGLIVTQ